MYTPKPCIMLSAADLVSRMTGSTQLNGWSVLVLYRLTAMKQPLAERRKALVSFEKPVVPNFKEPWQGLM
ncbi:hypothetical protein ColLi_11604 [Colletotrichum liriopes]|uniref:Uncharacterized protein n=1 Tax=Colletotrichum liriopes TaxID=708192 RepID=A0AA37LYL5_9PEZI|nr:hypothetical protein ColLi_11604 [Colletotrichum liriopes]